MNTKNDIAIRVTQLSKKYEKEGSRTDFRNAAANLFKKSSPEYLWALQDVSFEVKWGETLGIIGQNGSGKSTLLKILSGITKPTTGRVEIYGRIASILDIGAGFHPDLTGKENIYLKGQLMGMSKQTIAQHFEEIIAFSELKDFIHMPLKHYSDGMFLRLAFSTLIYLDADILLLDEVLAVGDIGFQQKCFEKILAMKEEGKTILIVSHNARELVEISTGYLQLEQGKMLHPKSDITILKNYLQNAILSTEKQEKDQDYKGLERIWTNAQEAPGDASCQVRSVAIRATDAQERREFLYTDQELAVELEFTKLQEEDFTDLVFSLNDEFGTAIMACFPHLPYHFFQTKQKGSYKSRCILPKNWLNQGVFKLNIIGLKNRSEISFIFRKALVFMIKIREENNPIIGELRKLPTPLAPVLHWELTTEDINRKNISIHSLTI